MTGVYDVFISHEVIYFPMSVLRRRTFLSVFVFIAAMVGGPLWFASPPSRAQKIESNFSDQEKPIVQNIRTLRQLPDDVRARTTKDLALQIRRLPAGLNKVILASGLANLSTEGDFGHETLQQVATTLAESLRENPVPDLRGKPAPPYVELAQLVRYEHVQTTLDAAPFAAAAAKLEQDDERLQDVDFSLQDLGGQKWELKDLKGKVVLVNFWATWCAPCRKEMPDLQSLYKKHKDKGFVVLAISDEDESKVKRFASEQGVKYPILLDPGKKVWELFQVWGIPRSFVYGRDGKLVTQSIDMRTKHQFQEKLALAGLH